MWQNISTAFPSPELQRVRPGQDGDPRIYALHHTGGLYYSNDGISWLRIGSELPNGCICLDFVVVQPEAFFVSTDRGVFHCSTTQGTWKDMSKGLPPNSRVSAITCVSSQEKTRLICGLSLAVLLQPSKWPGLYECELQDQLWKAIPDCPQVGNSASDIMDLVTTDLFVIARTRMGLVYLSRDAGKTYYQQSITNAISIGSSSRYIFVGTETGKLYRLDWPPIYQYPHSDVPNNIVGISNSASTTLVVGFIDSSPKMIQDLNSPLSWHQLPNFPPNSKERVTDQIGVAPWGGIVASASKSLNPIGGGVYYLPPNYSAKL